MLTKPAFENAILVAAAIAASTNCPIHVNAIARHVGVELDDSDWQRLGGDVPNLVNVQPAGEYLGESFHRAGGVPAVMRELLEAGKLDADAMTVSGRTVRENLAEPVEVDREVIHTLADPVDRHGGMLMMRGNLFDSAVMKVSVISDEFNAQYLSKPDDPDAFEGRAIVFEGPEDYHARIDDPSLEIDESCILVMRNTGPVGYPGSAEVVNMQPPAALLRRGIESLPTIGDGRQSGTSDCPSILNASPEAAVGGGLALLRTGDRIRVDLQEASVNVLLSSEELAERRRSYEPPELVNQTPWQEIHRQTVGDLSTGACMELALKYQDVAHVHGVPRDSH